MSAARNAATQPSSSILPNGACSASMQTHVSGDRPSTSQTIAEGVLRKVPIIASPAQRRARKVSILLTAIALTTIALRRWRPLPPALPAWRKQFPRQHCRSRQRSRSRNRIRRSPAHARQCLHAGTSLNGVPTGKPVEVKGINHVEFFRGRVMREWVLVDDVALWMQVLGAQA